MSTNEIKQAELMARLRAEFEAADPERQRELALADLEWALANGWRYEWNMAINIMTKKCCLAGAVMLRRYGRYVSYGPGDGLFKLSQWALRCL